MMGIISSCNSNQKSATTADSSSTNPLFTKSTLPFEAPPFDKIKDSDFKPALEEGMKQHLNEIEKIASNPDAPTFDNTLVAMEKSGELLIRTNRVLNVLTGANTDSTLQKLQEEEAPKLAAHQDAIFLNSKLFSRVKAIYDSRASLKLDPESLRLVEYYFQLFEKAGANLSDADKTKLKALNEQEALIKRQIQ